MEVQQEVLAEVLAQVDMAQVDMAEVEERALDLDALRDWRPTPKTPYLENPQMMPSAKTRATDAWGHRCGVFSNANAAVI